MNYKPSHSSENGDGNCASYCSHCKHDPFSSGALENIDIYLMQSTN